MTTRQRLFVMMVLEFFIWGAWLPLIFGYLPSLGFSPLQQSLILSAFPVASIVGMFFSNQWADRSAAPERVLALSHLVGRHDLVLERDGVRLVTVDGLAAERGVHEMLGEDVGLRQEVLVDLLLSARQPRLERG